jgi:hypothetical protein
MSYGLRQEPSLEPLKIRRYGALVTWACRATFVYRDPSACAKGRGICRRGAL